MHSNHPCSSPMGLSHSGRQNHAGLEIRSRGQREDGNDASCKKLVGMYSTKVAKHLTAKNRPKSTVLLKKRINILAFFYMCDSGSLYVCHNFLHHEGKLEGICHRPLGCKSGQLSWIFESRSGGNGRHLGSHGHYWEANNCWFYCRRAGWQTKSVFRMLPTTRVLGPVVIICAEEKRRRQTNWQRYPKKSIPVNFTKWSLRKLKAKKS